MNTTKLYTGHVYNPETGDIYSIKNKKWIIKTRDSKGYIRIASKSASRVIYTSCVGPIPNGYDVDHINCNKTDNRLCNLRAVPKLVNARNQLPATKRSGPYPGIRWKEACSKWISRVKTYKKTTDNEGYDARKLYEWYYATKIKMHGEDAVRHLPKPNFDYRITVANSKDPLQALRNTA